MKPRLAGLDGLRAIAILMVVVGHSSRTVGFPAALRHGASDATPVVGVNLFFALSGFLITWLLLGEEEAQGSVRLGEFYFRRAFRILPAAFVYLGVMALGSAMAWWHLKWTDVIAPAVFLANVVGVDAYVGHFWTLSIEEQFYLAWPAVLVAAKWRMRVPLTLGWILLSPVWRQINIRLFGAAQVNWGRPDLRFEMLIAGCLLALLWSRAATRGRLEPWVREKGTLIFAAGILGVLSPWVLPRLAGGAGVLIAMPLSAIAYALLVLVAVAGACGPLSVLLNWTPMVWLGRLSYSLYLWQQVFCYPMTGRWHERFPQNLGLAVLAASLSFFVIESPCLRLRGRLHARFFPRRSSEAVSAR